jgi:hypothetical protein
MDDRAEISPLEKIAIGLYKEPFIRLMLEEDRPRRWKYFKYKCNLKPGF